jgi:hypothetical protein
VAGDNVLYTPDAASFYSRTSIPMMTTMMMMMMMMVVMMMMMMMMMKNNNSWRKRANEIISNDSASFSSCGVIRSIRGKENLTCIVLAGTLLLVSAPSVKRGFFKPIGQYIYVNYITFIYEYAIRLLLCSATGKPQPRSLR